MGLKKLFLNKGWAGTTLSRHETAERLNPLIRRHHELNHLYEQAIRRIGDREAATTLNQLQKTARADVGKLSETVLSAGRPSFNGVELDSEDFASHFDRDGTDEAILERLLQHEEEFARLISDELDLEHQIRTRAILAIVRGNSRSRLDHLQGLPVRSGRKSKANVQ